MEIRCHASKRFLMEIDIEKYVDDIKKMGLDLQTPLTIKVPCKTCKSIEVYEVYKDRYRFISSYIHDNKK